MKNHRPNDTHPLLTKDEADALVQGLRPIPNYFVQAKKAAEALADRPEVIDFDLVG